MLHYNSVCEKYVENSDTLTYFVNYILKLIQLLLLLLLLCCRISHISALAGKYSPNLGCSNQQD